MPRSVLDQMRQHLEAGYPNEACGALIGILDQADHEVTEFVGMRNAIEGPLPRKTLDPLETIHGPWDRYELDPKEQLRIQKEAESRGQEIIGWAHSHPDHPAAPSEFDRKHAYDFYSYLVASVQKGTLQEARSWRLDDGGVFQEEPLTETA
jgi:proteasome lid subunit RPN8/RPN11